MSYEMPGNEGEPKAVEVDKNTAEAE